VTSGPDAINGRGGVDILRIDFTRYDGPELSGVFTNGGSITRTSSNPTLPGDSYSYANIERLEIIGGSKNDLIYSNSADYDDILIGNGGNDFLGGRGPSTFGQQTGGSDFMDGGEGNDTLEAQSGFNLTYNFIAGGADTLLGGPGDDLVEDIAFSGLFPQLAAGSLFKLDGGSGFDIGSADYSNQTAAIVWSDAAPANLDFADGAYFRNFEQLRFFATGSGNDSITQSGRIQNNFYLNAGNDVLNPGLGNDFVHGGPGDDLLILDFSIGDTPTAGPLTGGADLTTGANALQRNDGAILDRTAYGGFERVMVTGTSKNDSIGGAVASVGPTVYANDTIFGGAGNDSINGVLGGNDYLDGGDGDDTITGAADANTPGGNSDTIPRRRG
jgi:Ca2+-binding RTX toxin-like protein